MLSDSTCSAVHRVIFDVFGRTRVCSLEQNSGEQGGDWRF